MHMHSLGAAGATSSVRVSIRPFARCSANVKRRCRASRSRSGPPDLRSRTCSRSAASRENAATVGWNKLCCAIDTRDKPSQFPAFNCIDTFSSMRRSTACAWRNLLHLVWLPWARDLLHWSQMTFKSSGRMGAPRSLTIRRRAVMLPPWNIERRDIQVVKGGQVCK